MRAGLRRIAAAGALATACLLAVGPVAASASQASASETDVSFSAFAGEVNDVTISAAPGGLSITDPGAPITPFGPECVAVNPNKVNCSAPRVEGLSVELNDLGDKVVIDQSVTGLRFAAIGGGDGADQITVVPRIVDNAFLAGDDPNEVPGPGDGADVVNGGPGSESIFPGGGNDVVNGGGGGDGIGTSEEADGADIINGGGGLDSFSSQRTTSVQIALNGVADDGLGCPGPGCEGDNVMPDVEQVSTGEGDDVLIGSAGINSFFSGDGNDTVSSGGGADQLGGGDGDDVLSGDAGPDRIFGDSGLDRLNGGRGDDTLFSSAFDDDSDVLIGGKGMDLADYSDANARVRVDLDGKPDDGVDGENDNVRRDVEDVLGSRHSDVLVGSPRANDLQGGDGADKMNGGRGLDGLIGGDGDDRITGGKGRDLLDGGGGADRITSRDGGADQVLCGAALDRVKADRADRTTADCDRVRRA